MAALTLLIVFLAIVQAQAIFWMLSPKPTDTY
jgi:hypothetical protein